MRTLWDWIAFRWYLLLDAFDALREEPSRPELHTPHDPGFDPVNWGDEADDDQ